MLKTTGTSIKTASTDIEGVAMKETSSSVPSLNAVDVNQPLQTTNKDQVPTIKKDGFLRSIEKYASRRSNVYTTGGMVASSQPLAANIGRAILEKGGNAADAAVAVAAALAVTEPCSTGIGGDAFCLFYEAKTRQVKALNASGRCVQNLTMDKLRRELGDVLPVNLPSTSVHSVTVPGAAAGWADTVELFGSGQLPLKEILEPAAKLADEGFPVSEFTSHFWKRSEGKIKAASPNSHELLTPRGTGPDAGELMKLPNYARTIRLLGENGKRGFYEGPVAESIVETLRDLGSYISLEDLKVHTSTPVEPISVQYDGVKVYECPPNGQGITALIALGILDALEKEGKHQFMEAGHNSVAYLHTLIETMRLAFADSMYYVTDPEKVHVPVAELLSKKYHSQRARLVHADRASADVAHGGAPVNSSDTVYLSVVDAQGNACSFINSNYEGFGSAIVPRGCGFPLQNRGSNFVLDEVHPNCLAPGKRTYHTIIPAMVTRAEDDALIACYGVMGGFMQPQGHVQVLMNLKRWGMGPQEALDAPRFCIMPEFEGRSVVKIEEGISEVVVEGLRTLGHEVEVVSGVGRALFGRGQVILRREEAGSANGHVLTGGSDPRADGLVCTTF